MPEVTALDRDVATAVYNCNGLLYSEFELNGMLNWRITTKLEYTNEADGKTDDCGEGVKELGAFADPLGTTDGEIVGAVLVPEVIERVEVGTAVGEVRL